jgi:hypothetical protein
MTMEANRVVRGQTALIAFICLLCSCRTANDVTASDVATFDKVYRASKAIEAATHNGTDYTTFASLVQTYATEIEVAKDTAKSDVGKELLGLYSDGLVKYDDSRKFWSITIESEKNGYIDLNDFHGATRYELDQIINAYKVTLEDNLTAYPPVRAFKVDEGLSTIWNAAEIPVNKANAVYISHK